ncbi:phytoene/squalene synthetase [Roseimicrobium gellanilyticum]|uniref:Phytoene/squalene synthetase n=1 Tax=Roseimicrobium gellanilyticum TaxID=748857 RepID=A0A366HUR7_9BACT|nr:squalene/phytoene synthase family protein [Roseimicrobium gellanilyticum]RBP47274.1 phytoene/squalene synthetase [Roseimicrobium gellanilyticum]
MKRGVEWLCFTECLRFARRHRRYFGIFLVLYGRSLLRWRKMRAARVGYAFLQLFDDYMDGDRTWDGSLDALAARMQAEWDSGVFAGDIPLSQLGEVFWKELEATPEGRTDVYALLQAMHFDSQRRVQRLLLDEKTLHAHLHRTFYHSVDILLVVSGLQTRAREVPGLVKALAWCSVVRDFEDDVKAGIVNVPQKVVEAVRAHAGAGEEASITMQTPDVAAWLKEEHERVKEHLTQSRAELAEVSVREPEAAKLLGVFQRSVESYASR